MAAPEYTVVARRYRPQQFADLVGQEPVARALVNALQSGRVAHAYLFTGARGVGKTSTARILAKALNCEAGPTAHPCDKCGSCQAIIAGDDVDVLEIDGASNRGIDEVRSIRDNVGRKPSRSRYKVYIIDEVHMLTLQAFNALLKTLEEPPPHVKFIFATTDVQKLPVTILSRCQRFDFAHIRAPQIADRLREVVQSEGLDADEEALELVARRAAGSMRDAQSLLDQLLAFCGGKLTVEQVHALIGTATDERVQELARAVLGRDLPKVLDLLQTAIDERTQPGELLDQLAGYWRDLMLANVAGVSAPDLSVPASRRATLVEQAKAVPLDTIMAGLDLLTATRSRMRGSTHARTLAEMALIRLARLEDLLPVAQLAQVLSQPSAGVRAGATSGPRPLPPAPPEAKKKLTAEENAIESPTIEGLSAHNLPEVWSRTLAQTGPMLGGELEKAGLPAISGPKSLVLQFPTGYNQAYQFCSDGSRVQKVERAVREVTGQDWAVRLELAREAVAVTANGQRAAAAERPAQAPTHGAKAATREAELIEREPLLKQAIERLGARRISIDPGFGAVVRPAGPANLGEDTDGRDAEA